MSMRTITAALALFPAIALAADAPKLDVRMGLWENTSTTSFTGAPGMPAEAREEMQEAMKKMPPEQRAQMEALQKQLMTHQGAPQAHTDRDCLTREEMQKKGFFKDEDDKGHCTHTITQNDARTMAAAIVCSGKESSGKGRFVITATSPTAVTGTMDMTMTTAGKPMTMHVDLRSKWVGPECGDVK